VGTLKTLRQKRCSPIGKHLIERRRGGKAFLTLTPTNNEVKRIICITEKKKGEGEDLHPGKKKKQ